MFLSKIFFREVGQETKQHILCPFPAHNLTPSNLPKPPHKEGFLLLAFVCLFVVSLKVIILSLSINPVPFMVLMQPAK